MTRLPGWTGVYRDSKSNAIDVRPREGCPCFNELKNKEVSELARLLAKALNNQIQALEDSDHCDGNLLRLLKKHREKTFKAYKSFLEKSEE